MAGVAGDTVREDPHMTHHAPKQALHWCRQLVKQRAGNFFWGLRLLPEPKRSGLFALYAWMREADDIADNATEAAVALKELDTFASHTAAVFAGTPTAQGPMWESIAWAIDAFGLPSMPFEDMIEGQRHDLEDRSIETAEDLLEYCRCVASTVGELCITIWGYDHEEAPQLAIQRGLALQLTNVLRDIGEDAERGRCYLPREELANAGLTMDQLSTWSDARSCEKLTRDWIEQAAAFYASSAPLDDMISPDCRPTLKAMTGIYRRLLDQLDSNPSRSVLGPRARLSILGKVSIALRARVGAR